MTANDVDVDPTRCPICGVDNRCAMAAGSHDCWCARVTIARGVLDRVPETAIRKACVCASCASGVGVPSGSGDQRSR